MSSVLERLPDRGRVAVIRLRSMGDCILTTPALAILKQARPDLSIAMVVEDRFRALFEGNPDVAEILPPEWRCVRRWRPDLCLNLHGGGSQRAARRLCQGRGSARASRISGIRGFTTSGFHARRRFWASSRKVHTAEHLASAMFYLGAPRVEIPRARLFAAKPTGRNAGCTYAVIHPVRRRARQDLARGAVSRGCRSSGAIALNSNPVFIGGPGEDLSAVPRAGAPYRARRSTKSNR